MYNMYVISFYEVKQMATLRDVAQRAGVSAATVSRAFNNKYMVAEETYARIMEAVEELGYEYVARAAAPGSGDDMILLAASTGKETANTLQRLCAVHGYHFYSLPIAANEEDQQNSLRDLDWFLRQHREQMAGLLFFTHLAPLLEELRALMDTIPVVQINQSTPFSRMYQVVTGPEAPMEELIRRLYAAGRRRIALLSNDEICRMSPLWSRLRACYLNLCYDLGIAPRIWSLPITLEETLHAIAPVFEGPEPPDAVFSMGLDLTEACMEELKRRGLSVPENVALAEVSMGEPRTLSGISVTALTPGDEEVLLSEAVALLREINAGKANGSRQIQVPATLILQDSTGAH